MRVATGEVGEKLGNVLSEIGRKRQWTPLDNSSALCRTPAAEESADRVRISARMDLKYLIGPAIFGR